MARANEGPTLAEERVAPAGPWATFALVAIMLVTVALANVAGGQTLQRHPVNLGYYLIRHKWELLDAQRKPVDWLLLGDSSCNEGLRPDVIRRATGETALNLCTIADMLALSDVWMLDRYLSRVGKPKHVVVVHVADMWERGVDEVRGPLLAQTGLPFDFWRGVDPSLVLGRVQERNAWLAYHAPLYTENVSLRELFRHPGRLLAPPPPIDEFGYLRVDEGNEKAVDADAESERRRVQTGRGSISAPNRKALQHLVEVAERQGLEVSIVSAPLLDGLWQVDAFRNRQAEIMAELEQRLGASKHVRVRLPVPVLFPASALSTTVDHVRHEAAEAYTLEVLSVLH